MRSRFLYESRLVSSARKHAIKEFFRTLPVQERRRSTKTLRAGKLVLQAESSRLYECNLFVTVETFNRI